MIDQGLLDRILKNIGKVEQDLLCKECNGTGGVDTGASTPWGTFVTTTCPTCKGTGKFHLTREPYDATIPVAATGVTVAQPGCREVGEHSPGS